MIDLHDRDTVIRPPRVTRVSEVATTLGRHILCGAYAVGSVLPQEGTLLKNFGISRPVLREAIKLLEAKGLVKGRQRRGTVVLPRGNWNLLDADVLNWIVRFGSDPEMLLKLTEVRMIVEPGACRLAALNAGPQELEKIERAWHKMCEHTNESIKFRLADCEFHRAVLEATCNDYLAAIGAAISTGIEATIRRAHVTRDLNVVTLEPHHRILEAIRVGDADRAAFESTQQLQDTQRWLKESMSAGAPPEGD